MIQDIFDGKVPTVVDSIVSKVANKLFKGVERGYGKTLAEVEIDTIDHEMLTALKNNIHTFAAFKNHSEIQEIASLLLSGDDQYKTFASFRDEALKISQGYNVNWLRAEYELAVESAQSAALWVEFQATKDEYPLLRYKTQEDERVRDDHKPYNNIIRLVDDEWWDTHFPPNGWGCRCTVEKLPDGKVTDLTPDLPEIPRLFRHNPGKTREVFPDGHPYFEDVKESVRKKIEAAAKKTL